MTELDECAQSIYDEAIRNNVPRWKLPSTRDAWFKFVYSKMPDESYAVMDSVADRLVALMANYPIK